MPQLLMVVVHGLAMKTGRIVNMKTFVSFYNGDGRADWTFAVQIVFKDVARRLVRPVKRGNPAAAVSRSREVLEGRAATLRDPRRALGRAGERAGSKVGKAARGGERSPPRLSKGAHERPTGRQKSGQASEGVLMPLRRVLSWLLAYASIASLSAVHAQSVRSDQQ